MDELDTIISQAFDAGEDSGTGAPQIQDNDTGVTPEIDTGTPADSAAAPTETTETQTETDQLFDWSQVPPELMAQAKGFQASYTKRMQELAEQRKAFEAQQQQYAGFAALQQLAETDPAQAAQILQMYAAQLGGAQVGQEPETDPYTQAEPVTETERLLMDEVRALKEQQAQFAQFFQQQQQKAGLEALQSRYAALEKAIGRQLPMEERDQIAAHALKLGTNDVIAAYRDLAWETEMQRAMQRGRDEASKIVSQKAASPGAPSTLVNRAPSNPELPKDLDGLLNHIWDQAVANG